MPPKGSNGPTDRCSDEAPMRQALIILAFLLMACGRSASGRQPHDTPAQVSDPGAGGDKTPQDEAGPTRLAEAGATTRLRRAAPVWYTEQTPFPSRRIRAVGTEPFWSASVHDRCVTYSAPENQNGVRIWTKYSETAGGTQDWSGALARTGSSNCGFALSPAALTECPITGTRLL